MISWALAIQFLTRIPVPVHFVATNRQLGQSVLYYPLVGLMIGAVLWLLAGLLPNSHSQLSAALLLMFWVFITGALHLDGLADCADAWVGGIGDKQKTIAIMKDPSAGPVAVVILLLVLLLKWSAILVLIEQQTFMPLLIIPVVGRVAIIAMMLSTPYASKAGMAEKLMAHLPSQALRTVLLVSLLCAWYLLGFMPLLIAGSVFMLVRYWTIQRLGGATGDVYGTVVELVEVSSLVALVI